MKLPKIICFVGKKGVGKDIAADFLVRKYGYVKIAFADALKGWVAERISDFKPIPNDLTGDVRFWLDSCKTIFLEKFRKDGDHELELLYKAEYWVREKPYCEPLRKALQYVGTEYFRNKDPFYWIKSLSVDPDQYYVISDGRFLNEANYIQAIGGVVIKIEDPNESPNLDKHASEVELECIDANCTITNDKNHPVGILNLQTTVDLTIQSFAKLFPNSEACSWIEHE